jgi:hypothetical protein
LERAATQQLAARGDRTPLATRALRAPLTSPLATCRHLGSLSVEGSRWLRDAHLAPLPSLASTLTHLSLRGCSSVGAAKGGAAATLAALRGMTGIRSLDLSLTGFTRGPLRLSELLPPLARLTSLSLAGLQLDDAACAGLGAAAGLRALDLSDAVVTRGFVEGELGALTRLTRLHLNWCGAGALPLFGSLKVLELDHCRLGDVAHSAHGGEMQLERLSLAHASADGLAALALPEILRCAAGGVRRAPCPPAAKAHASRDCRAAAGRALAQTRLSSPCARAGRLPWACESSTCRTLRCRRLGASRGPWTSCST